MKLSINQLAQKYKVSVYTIRYYERVGLLLKVPRNKRGNRYYDDDLQEWIEVIICLRSSGMTVKALKEYVDMFKRGMHR